MFESVEKSTNREFLEGQPLDWIDLDEVTALEAEGHPFHGNQWTDRPSLAETDKLAGVMEERANLDGDLTEATERERSNMKAEVIDELAERLVGAVDDEGYKLDEAQARHLANATIKQWAKTANGGSLYSSQLQHAVAEEFGLKEAALNHLNNGQGIQVTKVDRAYARAEYENTQEFLEDNDITHITLFRGVGDSVPQAGVQTVTMQPISSWSTDLDTAVEFADTRLKSVNTRATILVTRVPASRVLSTAVTGRGALHEAEVLLLGGPIKVEAVKFERGENTPKLQRLITEKFK